MGYQLEGAKTPGLALFAGSFETDGTGAPLNVEGAGFSVGAPSTGVYTVTLTDGPFKGVVAALCSLEDSTADANDTVRFGDTDTLTTGKTFTIITASAAGTDGDLDGPRVHFLLLLRNTFVSR
jgi:hypothetical protein